MKNVVTNFLFCLTGFLIGTWTIRYRYGDLFGWINQLANSAGTHGTGKSTIFDLISYKQSALSLINQESWPFLIFVTLIISLASKFITRNKESFHSTLYIITFVIAYGVLGFAKYPLSHYQLGHYYLIVYLVILVLHRKHLYLLSLIGLFILLTRTPANIANYYRQVNLLINNSQTLSRYVEANPPKKGTVWEWGLSEGFALLWGRDWSTGIYDDEVKKVKPGTFSLQKGYLHVLASKHKSINLFDACWDQLYIQNQSLPTFKMIYHDKNFSIRQIPDTDHSLIVSTHCTGN